MISKFIARPEPQDPVSRDTISRLAGDEQGILRNIEAITGLSSSALKSEKVKDKKGIEVAIVFSPTQPDTRLQGLSCVYATRAAVFSSNDTATSVLSDPSSLRPYFEQDPSITALLVECRDRAFSRKLWTYYDNPDQLKPHQILGNTKTFTDSL